MDLLLLILFLFLRSLSPAAAAAADLADEASALISFRSAVGRAVLPWNTSISHCQWKGVGCSNDRVTSLRLPSSGLIGRIPTGTLGNLSSLRALSLRRNALSGPLPSDLAGCAQLRLLFLNGNRFSGEIPPFLSSLHALFRINLADNSFSGEIPLSFNNLRNLVTLYLENNHLTGEISYLDIPSLKQFNVSFNRLNGSVPDKLRYMPASSFLGTSLCGAPLGSCPREPAGSSNLSGGAIAGIVVGAVVLFLIIVVALFLLCRRKGEAGAVSLTEMHDVKLPEVGKKPGPAVSEYPSGIMSSRKELVFVGSGRRVFNLEDLLRASAEVMGKGTFGTVYKAELEMDLVVAVKRLREVNMPEKEFATKIEAVGAIQHPNLVPLRAYYYSKEEKLLVYDFMPHGSLFSILHGNRGHDRAHLNWKTRINIALEAARGIEFIHSTSPTASHGNIKSSNILFASSYEARVSDHGLAHIVPGSATSKRFSGAPEVIEIQRVTQKADVFSFGVVLLELLTGKVPAEGMLNGGIDLPRWVQSVIQEEWTGELFDAELIRNQSPEEEMVRLLQVGLDCTTQNPEHRPTMSVVVARIEEGHPLAANKMDIHQQQQESF